MNLCSAFVGCVMYTLPFPSLKFVCETFSLRLLSEKLKMDLLGNVRQSCCMVQMETVATISVLTLIFRLSESLLCNEQCVNCTPIQLINERQRGHATVGRMYPRVANDGFPSILKHTTRPPDFLARPQHRHAQSRCLCHSVKLKPLMVVADVECVSC